MHDALHTLRQLNCLASGVSGVWVSVQSILSDTGARQGFFTSFIKVAVMAQKVSKIDVWTCEIDDRPGALDARLGPLAAAGADLTFCVARRQADKPGRAVVFLGPLKGAKQTKAAEGAGLRRATELAALHFEGPNKPGSAHAVTELLSDSGINMRGLLAATIGKTFMLVLAFDSNDDADRALKAIKAGAGKGKKK
jgi:hypothetical protein